MGVVKDVRLSVYRHTLFITPLRNVLVDLAAELKSTHKIAFTNFQPIVAQNCIGSGDVKEKLR